MSITQLMTETADLSNTASTTHDGIGGYRQTLAKYASAVAVKIDARKTEWRYTDETLDRAVTHRIYLQTAVNVGDIVTISSVEYAVLSVSYFKDLNGLDSYYTAHCQLKGTT